MHNLRALQILMVEDNEDHAELMAEAFHEFNVKNSIHHVENGEEALTYLRNESPYEDETRYPRPDIVFLDLRMPKMGGAETLQAIRADEDLKAIPVVMVSTSKTEGEISECYELGASGYVTKPLKFEDLAQKIKELNYYWVLTAELPPSAGED